MNQSCITSVTRIILFSKGMKSLTQFVRFFITISYVAAVFGRHLSSSCNKLCGTGVFHAAGICQENGRCLCWWGWTGPNAVYIDEGALKNRILADYCQDPCHYTHDHRNSQCATTSTTTSTPATTEISTKTSKTTSTAPATTTQSTTPTETTASTRRGVLIIFTRIRP